MKKSSAIDWIIAFLVFPFFTAIYALFHTKDKYARIVLILFTALFGYCAMPGQGTDMYAYINSLTSSVQFDSLADYYTAFVTYLVSRVSDNGHLLMAVYGAVTGLLLAKSLSLFDEGRNKFLYYILVFGFANYFSLSALGGVRNITAFYLFFWGTIAYIKTEKKVYLIPVLLSSLVHYSFLIYIAIFILYYVLRNRPNIVYVIFALSFVVNFSGVGSLIGENMSFLSFGVSEKADVYLNADYQEYIDKYRSGYIGLGHQISFTVSMFICAIFSIMASINAKKHQSVSPSLTFFILVLLFLSFSNVFASVPHLSGRINKVCSALMVYPIFVFCRDNWNSNTAIKPLFYVYTMCVLFSCIIEIRYTSEITPLSLLFAPVPFVGISDYSVWQFLSGGFR